MNPRIDHTIAELRLLTEFGNEIPAADRYRKVAQLQQELQTLLDNAGDRQLAACLRPIAEAGPDRLGKAIGQAALDWSQAAAAAV